MTRRITTALLTAAMLASCGTIAKQETPDVLIVDQDVGGFVEVMRDKVARLERSGKRVELRGARGQIVSAGTMYLGLTNVCIHPEAEFGFHGASYLGLGILKAVEGDRIMTEHLPGELGEWFWREGRHLRGILGTTKSGRWVSEMSGVPLC